MIWMYCKDSPEGKLFKNGAEIPTGWHDSPSKIHGDVINESVTESLALPDGDADTALPDEPVSSVDGELSRSELFSLCKKLGIPAQPDWTKKDMTLAVELAAKA